MNRMPHQFERRRSGMTLVEILVVIFIIGVLASLLLVAVMSVMGRGNDAKNRYDIQQLGVALEKFNVDKRFYPPSRISLYPSASQYTKSTIDQVSLQYIYAVWPNIVFTNINWAGYDYNPSSQTWTPRAFTAGTILEGDQCLVFFLGGMVRANTATQQSDMIGFSTDPKNPAATPHSSTQGGDLKKYFEFDSKRLFLRNSPFPSYNDAYGVARGQFFPFVYFSSGKRANGYEFVPISGLNSVSPYVQQLGPRKYWNSSTYQILSAGMDGQFGNGGTDPTNSSAQVVWPPISPNQLSNFGMDDMTNFHDRLMGIPP